MTFRNGLKDLQTFIILFKDGEVDLTFSFLLQFSHGGIYNNSASHFRQFDKQCSTQIRVFLFGRTNRIRYPTEWTYNKTNGNSYPFVNCPHGTNLHRLLSLDFIINISRKSSLIRFWNNYHLFNLFLIEDDSRGNQKSCYYRSGKYRQKHLVPATRRSLSYVLVPGICAGVFAEARNGLF